MSEMHLESSYSYIPCTPHARWRFKKDNSVIGYFLKNSCYLPRDSSEVEIITLHWNYLLLHEFGHSTADMLENHGKMHQTFSYILDPARVDLRQVGAPFLHITVDHAYIEPFVAWGFDKIYGEPYGEGGISQDCVKI